MVANKWNVEIGNQIEGIDELVYRSNLIGSDRRVANWGGGNTSTKGIIKDFMGRDIQVMWVKGSGSDLATMKKQHFTTLRVDDLQPLKIRENMTDEEMVEYIGHCMVNANDPRASIETLLHAFLPYKHVDHSHPDAIISICCADNGKDIAKEIYGNRFVWVPYIRPGFLLSKMIAEAVEQNPEAELVLMEKHGLVTWGETSEECYHNTIRIINEAASYIESKVEEESVFGGQKVVALEAEERNKVLATILPTIRGAISKEKGVILTHRNEKEIMQFVNSYDAKELSQIGAACPDHLVHTKRIPLYIDYDHEIESMEALCEKLTTGIEQYEADYNNYFENNKEKDDKIGESYSRVIIIPGLGLITSGKNYAMAKVSGDLFERAISVMKGATTLGNFVSLSEQESFLVEYWPLELYKLSLAPKEKEFSRKVAFITGGAGGIGKATCKHFADEGAHIVIADLNNEAGEALAVELRKDFPNQHAIAIKMDVTDEGAVINAITQAILTFGGVDIVVNNAGLATSSPFEETTLKEWNLNMNVLNTGYFLVAREAFKHFKAQKTGGNMVFVGSKNSIYAGKNAAAYSTAKAAELHLARCIATEGGPYGIRVNAVLPDAVLQGSAIWNSDWREERAQAYGIHPDELESYYQGRTILGVSVFPDDIAKAIAYFASSHSSKTTGCMLTVDGGVAAAFAR